MWTRLGQLWATCGRANGTIQQLPKHIGKNQSLRPGRIVGRAAAGCAMKQVGLPRDMQKRIKVAKWMAAQPALLSAIAAPLLHARWQHPENSMAKVRRQPAKKPAARLRPNACATRWVPGKRSCATLPSRRPRIATSGAAKRSTKGRRSSVERGRSALRKPARTPAVVDGQQRAPPRRRPCARVELHASAGAAMVGRRQCHRPPPLYAVAASGGEPARVLRP